MLIKKTIKNKQLQNKKTEEKKNNLEKQEELEELEELEGLEEEKKFFCIDTRIRDIKEKTYAINYCKTLEEDESIIVMEEFYPYIYIKHPFEKTLEEIKKLEEYIKKVLKEENLSEGIKKTKIEEFKKATEEKKEVEKKIEEKTNIIKKKNSEYKKSNNNKILLLKIYFKNLDYYFKTKEIIKNNPQKIIELYSKTSLKKKYYIEKKLTPLTLWSSNLYALPMTRVKVYETKKIIQEDTLTYENPNILSFSLYYEEFLDKILLKDNSIKTTVIIQKKYEQKKCKIITWKKIKIIGEYCKTEYYDSELDLLKELERTIALEKPIVISGYNTDEIEFPRIMKRIEKYKGKVNFKISDDFSKPYKARLGYTLNGYIHLDLKKTISNLKILEEYEEIYYLLEESQIKRNEKKPFYDEIEDNKLLLTTTKKIYPLLVELSKLTLESLFDISRFENYKFYQSYYETYTLKHKLYYEEYIEDYEEYSLPKINDLFFSKENNIYENFLKSIIKIKFLYPIISLKKNVSKELLNCDCCKKDFERNWFCEKKIGNNLKILEQLIKKYDLYEEIIKKNPILKKQNSMIYSKLKVYELLLKSYEYSIRNRKSTLYFPEGDSIIKEEIKKTIEELKEKNKNIIAFSEEKIFLKETLKENIKENIKEDIKENKNNEDKNKNDEDKNNEENTKKVIIQNIIIKENNIIKKIAEYKIFKEKLKEEKNNIIEKVGETIGEKIQELKEGLQKITGTKEKIKEKNEINTLKKIEEHFQNKNYMFKNKIEEEKLIGGFLYKINKKSELKTEKTLNYSYITENYEYKIKEKYRFKNYCNYTILLRDTLSRKIIDLLKEHSEKKITEEEIKEEIKEFLEKKIKKLFNNEIDYEDLIIKNKLYKNLEYYEKETLFVKAAEELKLLGYEVKKNSIIPYIVIKEEKKIVIPTKENFSFLKNKFFNIDKEYYLYKQIYPIIKNILQNINFTEEEIKKFFYKIKMLS